MSIWLEIALGIVIGSVGLFALWLIATLIVKRNFRRNWWR